MKSTRKENKPMKDSSKHFFSFNKVKSQHLITKSDLSNKLKILSSGNELKSYLLNCSTSLKVEPISQITRTIEHTAEVPQQQPSNSLVYKDIIKRVLKINK